MFLLSWANLYGLIVIFALPEWVAGHASRIMRSHAPISHLSHEKLDHLAAQTFSAAPEAPHRDICTKEALCVPWVQCPSHVSDKSLSSRAASTSAKSFNAHCKTIGGRAGVCCTSGQNHSIAELRSRSHQVRIDSKTLKVITRKSREEMTELRSRESRLLFGGHATILMPGSASYGHFRNSRVFSSADLSDVMDVATRALEIAIATRAFKDRQGITNRQLELGLIEQDLRPTPMGGVCKPPPFCDYTSEKYRRIDGACNNELRPAWGSFMTPYARLLPPSYKDGVWMPRVGVDGEPLTSPRIISTTVFRDDDVPDYDYTLMLMQFGQFLAHDLTQSIDTTYQNGSAISCCLSDGSDYQPPEARHYACMPIEISAEDLFYGNFDQKCMNFVRSVLAPNHDCTLGYAQQMNKITHFIDGSSIYGSFPEQTSALRSFEAGRLRVFEDFHRDLLPLVRNADACLTMEQGSACFESGDTRTNQMVSLVVLHTIFLREHNRVAGELARLNPHWADQRLFLEARQIVIAELQVIVYKEFLPTVVGTLAMEEFQLLLRPHEEYAQDYDPNINPSVTNEFGTAAFRFGHSMVDGLLKVYGKSRLDEIIAIPEIMFHPSRLRKKQFLDQMLSTMTTEPVQKVDNCLSEALTRYMFRAGNPFGVDLVSLNIQRGRDHGIRPYNDYRELVGLPRMKSFSEFPEEVAEKMKLVYKSVDDVDLWVGGLFEEKAPGAVVGFTFRDIIADQFFRSKHGDKYFFEYGPTINPGYFEPDQLAELKKTSMSRLICDNRDGILLVRQALNAFRKPGVPGNEFYDCNGPEIPKVNLGFWQE